jgi:thiol:disulfide interchange protein
MIKRIIISLLFLAALLPISAQIEIPVTWKYNIKDLGNNEIELILKSSIEDKWHMYSQFTPDGGPLPLYFEFEKSDKYELIDGMTEQKHHTEYDDIFKVDVYYFKEKATFTQKVKVLTEEAFNIKGFSDYQVCIEGKCIPGSDDFDFAINGGVKKESTVGQSVSKEVAPLKINTLELGDAESVSSDMEEPVSETDSRGLWVFFFISFLAGLAAILTPCVFPMIPMTVTFFMKDKDQKGKGRVQALVYGFSIIAIYTFIGSILAVVAGPDIANFLSTHWIPNVLFFLIFMFFAASFLGMFEIVLPSSIVNKSDAKADKGGIVGAIFMAVTLVLVSFSCTGPIVGAILVESAGGQVLKPIIGMFGFSLAFALPFTLFAFFPGWLSNLPKSGGWLNSVKVILGFIEIALGLKFLSVADQTYHWGILDREIYIAFWIVIFTLMGFYLLGKLKFSHDSDLPYVGVPRLLMAIVTFTFVIYLLPGMWGAPLKALSGYLPPLTTHDFNISDQIRKSSFEVQDYIDEHGSVSSSSAGKTELCEKPKFSNKLHLPHGLKGYFDLEQALDCAKKQNKPVFIDFTGHGCVNCREMEANVWSSPEVLKRLRHDFIVVALYVDDKTIKLPEDEWITSTYDGKIKKTLGKKLADLQITRFNVNAQPFYVLMDHNEKSLVKPVGYDLDVDKFVKFLDDGLEEFKKRQ